eukprot:232792_1
MYANHDVLLAPSICKQTMMNESEAIQRLHFDANDIDIKKQSFDYYIYENNTFWHKLLPIHTANIILSLARSKYGIIFTCVMCVMYMFGLYTFDTGLFENYNHFSTYYSIIILIIALPISILYLGTLNVQISVSIVKSFTFWFKIYNIFISNILSVVW